MSDPFYPGQTDYIAQLNALATTTAANVAVSTNTAASKTTPIDADEIPLVDSTVSFTLKKLTWGNLKATILAWLQGTVFPAPGTIGGTTPGDVHAAALSASGTVTVGSNAIVLNHTTGTVTSYGGSVFAQLQAVSTTTQASWRLDCNDANAGNRNWAGVAGYTAYGDFVIRQSNARLGDPLAAGTTILSLSSAGLATNLAGSTGLPVSTGISGLGTGIATALATPTLANLNAAVSDADVAQLGANTFTGAQAISDSTEATSTTAASLKTAGGLAVTKSAYVGGTLYAQNISVGADICWTQSTDTYTRSSGLSAATQVVTDIHANMRRCVMRDDGTVAYYLSATDSAYKEDGVTASVLTGADGQVMVEIPATYVKWTPGATRKWATSPVPGAGFELHPAFMKDGVFVPYRYRGAYTACFYDVSGAAYLDGFNWDTNPTVDATATTGDKLASVSGKYPLVGVTRAQCRVLAANRGPGWRVNDYWLDELIKLLFLVEYGTFNAQAKLGDGNSAGSYAAASSGTQTDSPHSIAGKSNSLGNASTNTTTGASSGTRDTAFMSYRGIENWYGNCFQFVDGVNFNNGQTYVSNVRANFADDTTTGYDILGVPNVATSGWQTDIQQLPFSFLPSAAGGGSTTYLADYYYYAAGWRVTILGGDADHGAADGPFFLHADAGSAALLRYIGVRLAY